ncbi:MAG: hypothetical protein ABWW65_04045 [Thermoprotei archaeon]
MHEVCVDGFSEEDKVYLSLGLRVFGCSPTLRNCTSDIRRIEDKFVVETSSGKVVLCSSRDLDCTVIVNKREEDMYVHLLYSDDKIVEGYITEKPIDIRVATGMTVCLLQRGYGVRETLRRVFSVLSLGGGDPFEYLQIILSEYNCFTRLLAGLERLLSNRTLLEKIMENYLLMGCRALGKTVYSIGLYGSPKTPLIDTVKRYSVEVHSEYGIFSEEESFVCFQRSMERENVESYGFRVKEFNGLNCITGKDLVKILILLEKIY